MVELGSWESYHLPMISGQIVSSSPQINSELVDISPISVDLKSSQVSPNSQINKGRVSNKQAQDGLFLENK